MSDRGKLEIPYNTRQNQALASNPDYSIWVEANAGSGKTFVLTHRVLRLLLAGVRPQSILCLTYTKAAAAEMRKRVGDRLARWAVEDEAELRKELTDLTGNAPDSRGLAAARTLFARALETPGGLRILTIHAFCEAVLHRFPIEAGVPFDFAVIEEDRQTQMVMAARDAVLAEGLRGGQHANAVETLFGLLSDHAIGEAINSALGEGARLDPVLADPESAKARLRNLVGHTGDPVEAVEARLAAETLLGPAILRDLVSRCQANPGGDACVDLLARLDPERPHPALLRQAFFTKGGEPRKRLLLKAQKDAHPDIDELLVAEQERLVRLEAEANAALLVARSEAVLDVVAAIRSRYDVEKRRHALLDFDDLIEKLGDLLADPSLGPWVQYKLDAGIDHILVDESQDTNARQWRVVRALADDFFSGAGAVTRPRSIFAVGDQKQSIYSFQGAQPVLFGETGRDIRRRAGEADKPFEDVRLHTSFRTLSGILEAVDRVAVRDDIRAALLSVERVGHEAARVQPGGTVTLWPPVQDVQAASDTSQWPVVPVETEQSANRQVAVRIAREIRNWVAKGRLLGERNRPVRPDDVLILVQKRGALFAEIIRALRAEGVPTPGADRLGVTGHIAVLDLLALIDVLLNPADDLQLAALLRSPLFEFSEDDLFRAAHDRPRGQSLWAAVFASSDASVRTAAEQLGRWRGGLDMERPFEFLTGVLYADGGLRRFHARLGAEVDEVLSELLELALAHEQGPQPSIQGFAADIRRRAVTIKRELAETGGGVRVMTVHGAKGLEAPIVILADAASKPAASQAGKPVYVLENAPGPLLIHASSRGQHVEATTEIKQRLDATLAEEYWRRLYVAMTRAEDELYVTGALSAASTPEKQLEGSWYQAIEQGLGADAEDEENVSGLLTAKVFPKRPEVKYAASGLTMNQTMHTPLTVASVPPQPTVPWIQPSGVGDSRHALDTAAERLRDAETARLEGLALHALLQHLVRIAPDDRRQVSARALETLLPGREADHERVAAKAMSILSRPELAHLFGPDSRAEVPFRVEIRRNGEPAIVSGRIDRVVVDDATVTVIDYKSDATMPGDVDAVPRNYLSQLGLYALVAGQLFPGRSVRAAILWTELESLMNLPHHLLAEANAAFTLK
jgi:ATP-dependent helicase/nuclease subunit A